MLSVSLQLYHLHYLFLIPREMHLLPPVGKEEQVMEVVKMQRDRGHNLPRPSDHLCRPRTECAAEDGRLAYFLGPYLCAIFRAMRAQTKTTRARDPHGME